MRAQKGHYKAQPLASMSYALCLAEAGSRAFFCGCAAKYFSSLEDFTPPLKKYINCFKEKYTKSGKKKNKKRECSDLVGMCQVYIDGLKVSDTFVWY